ncbi:MAG TPA: SMR family transporter [Synergistales bacterium]|jgi:multidrug transporter EmrE-like cation transporter|nr:SMR family transporter [Synergistales bacterium]
MDRLGMLMILGSALFNATASSMMKIGFGHQQDLLERGFVGAVFRIVSNPWAVAGVICFGVSFMFMSAALTRVDLSVAYPVMSGLVFILVLGVSSVFFAEHITVMRLVGVFLILSGVLAISR